MVRHIVGAVLCLAVMQVLGNSQSCTLANNCVCAGNPIPSGDIITQIQTLSACGIGVNNAFTVKRIQGEPSDAQETACANSPIPLLWAIMDTPVSPACGNSNPGNARTLRNLNGKPLTTPEDVCQITDVNNLPGWIITVPSEHVQGCGDTPTVAAGMHIVNKTNVPPPPPPPPPPSSPPDLAPLLQWGAQNPQIGHVTGFASSNGTWAAQPPNSGNYLSYGPYTTINNAGDYVAAWRFSEGSLVGIGMGFLDVNDASTQTQITVRQGMLSEFTAANQPATLTLPFTVDPSRAGHQFEFRVLWPGNPPTTEYVLGYVPLDWNGASNPWHLVGQSFGTEWMAQVGDGQQWFQYGPYVQLDAGTYIAMWTLRIDVTEAFNNEVALIDVNDATLQQRVAIHSVMRQDFQADNTQQVIQLPFTVDALHAGHVFEFRIWYDETAQLSEAAFGYAKVQ